MPHPEMIKEVVKQYQYSCGFRTQESCAIARRIEFKILRINYADINCKIVVRQIRNVISFDIWCIIMT